MLKSLNRKVEFLHRNNKQLYYLNGFIRDLWPDTIFQHRLNQELRNVKKFDETYLLSRVNFYNQLYEPRAITTDTIALRDLDQLKRQATYYLDSREHTRFFDSSYKARFVFGDVLSVPSEPTILKYRPVAGHTTNYVLLKLNKVRLFNYSTDHRPFRTKKNKLIGRAVVKVPGRVRFYEQYFNHPMCDLGQINRDKNLQWLKDKVTIDDHLDYKFILCLEGYDIASNLRWVMSSNSLAVMPEPTVDSWYMERKLIPNYHYVRIKADYSDLEERLTYYIEHPDEAETIIQNARQYASQFQNPDCEHLISLLVLEKYFWLTGQKDTKYQALFTRDAG
jgi:Glycosyl transferase family 90